MAKILKEIKSKVTKIESVKWQELKQLQTDNFKELTKENYEKLKASLINNNFVMAFTIWEDKAGAKYIIDGVHRFKTLQLLKKENYKVPDNLPAIFIDCKDKKEAVKILLLYSSQYAVATDTGMSDLINLYQLDINKLINEIQIPDLSICENQNDIFLNYDKIDVEDEEKNNDKKDKDNESENEKEYIIEIKFIPEDYKLFTEYMSKVKINFNSPIKSTAYGLKIIELIKKVKNIKK